MTLDNRRADATGFGITQNWDHLRIDHFSRTVLALAFGSGPVNLYEHRIVAAVFERVENGRLKGAKRDSKFHRFLLDAFDRRIQADYSFEALISSEEVTAMIDHAREFLAEVERMFEKGERR